jgi:hypothetical protein
VINIKKKKRPLHIRIMMAAVVLLVAIFVTRASMQLIDSIASYQTVKMFTEIRLAFYLYQAQYHKAPGDDNLLPRRGEPWDKLTNNGNMAGNADGMIDYLSTPYSESSLVWSHLRAAGFIPGDVIDMTPPRLTSGVVLTILTTSLDDVHETYLCARNLNERTTRRITAIYNNRNQTLLDTELFSPSSERSEHLQKRDLAGNQGTKTLCTVFF